MKDDDDQYRPCAGVVLINRDGLVWSGERADMPGAWQLPQGGIDAGEDPLEAALRELEEETGLPRDAVEVVAEHPVWLRYDLPDEIAGSRWKGRFKGQRQKWFLVRLTGEDSQIDIDRDPPEFGQWRWSTPEEVIEHIVDFKRPVYAAVLAEFEDVIG